MLIRGTSKWAKITGEPHWGYESKFKEWSIDVYIDEETAHRLEVEGLKEKIKDKGNGQYVSFKRKELKVDGTPNSPIRIVDDHGTQLQGKNDDGSIQEYVGPKIGNGSVVNVNFAVNEFKKGQFSMNILSLQIWDLVRFDAEFPIKDDSQGEWVDEVPDEAEAA